MNSYILHNYIMRSLIICNPHPMKSGNLNFLEPSGPLQACNGTAFTSPNIVRVIKSRRMRWAGHVGHMEEKRGLYRVLMGKSEGRRPLGRPRRRWEDFIKMGFQEVVCRGLDLIELVGDRDS